METVVNEKVNSTAWIELAHRLGKDFAERAADHDRNDTFVEENYNALKEHKIFSATIPKELGGDGISHAAMCDILRTLAQYCSSTALALSMHQHLIAANIWKYKHGKGGEETLKKVAEKQLVLVSTGAGDWLESNGKMEKTEGGYLVTAHKHFASQAPAGDVLVTSAPYQDPESGWEVLHFPVSFAAEGVTVMDNWYTLGMRGTGSHTVKLEKVFVPESAIVLRRPQGKYHMFWNVVLTVAMPLIMSVYVGIAERAAKVAIEQVKVKQSQQPHLVYLVGEMYNTLTLAQVLLKDMISITNNYDFQPENENGNAILIRKTLVANACISTVNKAMEAVGGQSFFRKLELERLFRDVQAGIFHPLQEKQQHAFTGSFVMNHIFHA